MSNANRFLATCNLVSGIAAAVVLLCTLVVDGHAQSTAAEIDKALVKTAPAVFGLLRAEFSMEYGQLVLAIEETVAVGGSVRDTSASHLRALRVSQAANIGQAQDAALVELMQTHLNTIVAVRDNSGTEACGQVILHGMVGVPTAEVNGTYGEHSQRYLVALTEAAISGRDNPAKRKPSSDADWTVLSEVLAMLEISVEQADAFAAEDPSDPNFCSSTVLMLQAMLTENVPAISRVRADYLEELAGIS